MPSGSLMKVKKKAKVLELRKGKGSFLGKNTRIFNATFGDKSVSLGYTPTC